MLYKLWPFKVISRARKSIFEQSEKLKIREYKKLSKKQNKAVRFIESRTKQEENSNMAKKQEKQAKQDAWEA